MGREGSELTRIDLFIDRFIIGHEHGRRGLKEGVGPWTDARPEPGCTEIMGYSCSITPFLTLKRQNQR